MIIFNFITILKTIKMEYYLYSFTYSYSHITTSFIIKMITIVIITTISITYSSIIHISQNISYLLKLKVTISIQILMGIQSYLF
jgi:hypothetical protein